MGKKIKHRKKIYEFKFISSEEKEEFLNKSDINISADSMCSVCGDRINPDNIGMLSEKSGEIVFICNKPKCLKLNKIISHD